jgi:exosome complex RNA-binding protein Csl4
MRMKSVSVRGSAIYDASPMSRSHHRLADPAPGLLSLQTVSRGGHMMRQRMVVWNAGIACLLVASGACSQLGSILGGMGGSPQSNQVSGYVEGVNTRTQQIAIQTSNGQVVLSYDNQTAVVYQNQQYPVTALERGDQVTARVQSTSGGAYYTDLVQVDRSVSGGGGSASGNVQSLQGTVGQIDRANGRFRLDGNNASVIVSLPYNVRQSDLNTFQNLRLGDRVRFYGVFLDDSRVELRQFY